MAAFAVSGSITVPMIEWQWKNDSGRWVDYDATSSSIMERDFLAGLATSSVHSAVGGRRGRGASYDVNFWRMEQVNSQTGFVRAVRRNAASNGSVRETWSWMDGSLSRWDPVPLRVCLQITAARDSRGEQSTPTHIGAELFDFSLAQMAAINRQTGARQPLRAGGAGTRAPVASSRSGLAGAAANAPVALGSGREAEFRSVLAAAKDCTDEVGDDDRCAVCIEPFDQQHPGLLLSECKGHYIHGACALEAFAALGPKCPTCSIMYGEVHGTQPDGTMTIQRFPPRQRPLAGHSSEGTIVISYSFPSGVQGPKHPSPGRAYSGTSRTAYLPDSREGNEVLELLRKAFDRRVTFTIGTSITTGRSNTVVWNGIHHKTNVTGGSAMFGYPDATYFSRVKAELLAKGIS